MGQGRSRQNRGRSVHQQWRQGNRRSALQALYTVASLRVQCWLAAQKAD